MDVKTGEVTTLSPTSLVGYLLSAGTTSPVGYLLSAGALVAAGVLPTFVAPGDGALVTIVLVLLLGLVGRAIEVPNSPGAHATTSRVENG